MPRLTSKPLTQKTIDSTASPAGGCVVLRDHEQRGLALRIWPAGTKSWSFEYRSPVTDKNVRLGLPTGTLAEARTIAKSHRALVALGRDPALEAREDLETRRERHAKAVSVKAAFDLYQQNTLAAATAKLESKRRRLRVLRRALEPFNERVIASLGRGDLIKRLDAIQVGSGAVSRNRAQSELRCFLGWALDREMITKNELDRVRMSGRETPRDRVLNNEELRGLIKATDDGSTFSIIVQVLLHTAMRRNEAASLQPRDLDFENGTITVRAEVSKTQAARTIPMNEVIAGALKERAKGVKREGYIFGDATEFERPFAGFSKCFARLWATMPTEMDRWTLHDIRRTVATRLHETGVDALVIEDLLGHRGVRRGVAGVYNRSLTLERQRLGLKAWSAKLAALEANEREAVAANRNVTPLRASAAT
jgi:integrase